MDNMITEDNLSLNLYIVSTTYYMVVTSDNQSLVRIGEFLVRVQVKFSQFQTKDCKVFTWSYIY